MSRGFADKTIRKQQILITKSSDIEREGRKEGEKSRYRYERDRERERKSERQRERERGGGKRLSLLNALYFLKAFRVL